jgi:hypothetical protein
MILAAAICSFAVDAQTGNNGTNGATVPMDQVAFQMETLGSQGQMAKKGRASPLCFQTPTT